MKIEIDLDKIMGSQEEVRQSVIEEISEYFKKEFFALAEAKIADIIKDIAIERTKKAIEEIYESGLDKKYKVVDSYGIERGETSLREEILKVITSEATFDNRNIRYGRMSTLTEIVTKTIEEKLDEFKEQYSKIIDKEYLEACKEYAVEKIKERLNIRGA